MSRAQVRVAGRLLDTVGNVSSLTDSTIFRPEGWSGDYQASCVVQMPVSASPPPWLRRGAAWETCEAGVLTWGGFVTDVARDGGTLQVSAYGRGYRADEFPAIGANPDGAYYVSTQIPNAAVDAAESRGIGFGRAGVDLGAASMATAPDEISTIAEVLDRRGAQLGKSWWVDSYGRVTFRSKGALTLVVRPGEDYIGTADDEYVTRLWGFVISGTTDGTGSGEPNQWRLTHSNTSGAGLAREQVLRDRWGPAERIVDMTGLGFYPDVNNARADLNARYEQIGGRMGWTNGLELTETNVRRKGTTVGAPLSARAGDQLMLPGVVDDGTSGTYLPNVALTLAEVVRNHDENRAQVKPVGLAPRGFAAALEAPQRSNNIIRA